MDLLNCTLLLESAASPFYDAFVDSDFLGKLIFTALIILSVTSWSILLHKLWMIKKVKRSSISFKKVFLEQKIHPLDVTYSMKSHPECPNAFAVTYEIIRQKAIEVFEKNNKALGSSELTYLSSADIGLLDSCASSTISSLTKYLERNLYILSTTVTLAPFLGLLGTVYGILTTFSGMKDNPTAASNQMVLGGLSLALTTTVLGLVGAIPALIGYNYLKNSIHDFDTEMSRFANDILSAVELHYRKVE
jgi:biopolymer transport protein TolQ